jgi:phage FluMu protein Com
MKCEYCKDLNAEKQDMEVSQIHMLDGWFNYEIPIKYCPNCGKILKKYENKTE